MVTEQRSAPGLASCLLRFLTVVAVLTSMWGSWPRETGGVRAAGAVSSALPAPVPDAMLQHIIEADVPQDNGTWGISVRLLRTGQSASLLEDSAFPSASLYKLGALYSFFQQQSSGSTDSIRFDTILTLMDEDMEYGTETLGVAGTEVDARHAVTAMIDDSDNSAAQLLLRVLGRSHINSDMRQLGLTRTLLHTFDDNDPLSPDTPQITSPSDMTHFLTLIATRQMVDAQASESMLDILLHQHINDRLPALLPDGTPVAHKTGDLLGVVNDAGIIMTPAGPVIMSVLSQDVTDMTAGRDAIAHLARDVYDYADLSTSHPGAGATVGPGSVGPVVEPTASPEQLLPGVSAGTPALAPAVVSGATPPTVTSEMRVSAALVTNSALLPVEGTGKATAAPR